MIQYTVHGDFKKTFSFIQRILTFEIREILKKYGEEGVKALAAATPVRTGKTAASWDYYITIEKNSASIVWTNSNIADGVPVAILLDYGHATSNGGYVQGKNFIAPAIQPVFDKIAEDAWKEVTEKR